MHTVSVCYTGFMSKPLEFTYFIATSDESHVKIGRSTNLPSRITALQTAVPLKLKILRVIHGNHERRYHTMFEPQRSQGEWFVVDDSIRSEIAGLAPFDATEQALRPQEPVSDAPTLTFRLIGKRQVLERLGGVSRWTLWRMVKEDRFPRPIEVTTGCRRWLEHEVDNWIQARGDRL